AAGASLDPASDVLGLPRLAALGHHAAGAVGDHAAPLVVRHARQGRPAVADGAQHQLRRDSHVLTGASHVDAAAVALNQLGALEADTADAVLAENLDGGEHEAQRHRARLA